MTRASMRATLVAALACFGTIAGGCCFGSGLDQQEERYRWKVQDLDDFAKRADPETKKVVEEKKAAIVAEYEAAPASGEERRAALEKLNDGWRPVIASLKEKIEKEEEARKAKAEQEAAGRTARMIEAIAGTWSGGGMDLVISQDGKVDYKLEKPGTSKSLQGASIKKIDDKEFETSVLGISSTFRIDEAPHQVEGKWKMKIDGIELTRIDPP